MTKTTLGPRTAWIVGLGGVVGVSLLSLLWGCSSSSSPGVLSDRGGTDSGADVVDSSVVDTSVVDSGTPPSEGAAPMCTLVDGGCGSAPSCGAQVNIVQVAQTPPVASAGSVVPGTYVMTDFTIFTGSGGATGSKGGAWANETLYLSLPGVDAGAPMEAGPAGDGAADDGAADGAADDAAAGTDAGVAAEAGPTLQVFQLLEVNETNTSAGPQIWTGTMTFSAPNQASQVFNCPSATPTFDTTYTATQFPAQLQLFTAESPGVGVITYTKM
jgi:hypothetical protein